MRWSKVLVAESPLHAGLAKITLESAGLTVQLRQMDLWAVAVEVLYSEGAAPSVWVPENQADKARELLRKHQEKLQSQTQDSDTDWLCSHCGERNGSNFQSCWQCGEPGPLEDQPRETR